MNVILPSGRIGVAVSGGIDSMALLHCLINQQTDITVINIEHGIRGAESIKDSDFVASFCKKNNLKLLQFSIDTIAESKKRKISIELCARILRYEIFYNILNQKKVDYIALAHHADDNAETILMRILRGTGIKGLKGIVDHSGFIHPLINHSRQQIEDYAKQNNVPFIVDSTNEEDSYTRNFIRNNALKSLKERFENLHESFNRLAQNAQEADDFIRSQTLDIYEDDGGYYILAKDFNAAHNIIKQYTLIKLFNQMDVFQDIEARHFDYINELGHMQNNSTINLPFDIVAVNEYDKLFFYKQRIEKTFFEKLDFHKSYVFEGIKYSFLEGDKVIKGVSFDKNKMPTNAIIRTRQNGDVFKRYGGGTKKLNDYLTDIKIPKRQRDKLLVVARENEVLMLCGWEISDKIKIDDNTTEILYIKKEILCEERTLRRF